MQLQVKLSLIRLKDARTSSCLLFSIEIALLQNLVRGVCIALAAAVAAWIFMYKIRLKKSFSTCRHHKSFELQR